MLKNFLLFLFIICSQKYLPQCYKSVDGGFYNVYALQSDSTLWGMGDNSNLTVGVADVYGLLARPYEIARGKKWRQVCGGFNQAFGILTDGSLWHWGDTTFNASNLPAGPRTPRRIGADNDWLSVSTGFHLCAAIKTNGTLWIWGSGAYGELVYISPAGSNFPKQFGTDNDWASVSLGTSCIIGIKKDGTMWAWGKNNNGILGQPTNLLPKSSTPVQIGTDADWKTAAAGYNFALAIKSDSSVWKWGFNFPVPSDLSLSKCIAIDSRYHGTIIKSDGTLWTMGRNNNGELGLGNSPYISTDFPLQVGNDSDWVSATPGYSNTFAIKKDGSFWEWGVVLDSLYNRIEIKEPKRVYYSSASYITFPDRICSGESVTLTLNGLSTYTWNIPATGNTAVIKPFYNKYIPVSVVGKGKLNCDFIVTPVYYVDECTSVAQIANDRSISFYPNPAEDKLGIRIPQFKKGDIRIVDLQGRLLLSQVIEHGSQINIDHLQKGQYLVTINVEGLRYYSKLIKH